MMGRVPFEEWKQYFLLNQKAMGLTKRTLDDYIYHIDYFFHHSNIDSIDDLKMAVMKYFAASTELSPYTWNTRRKKLKTFFQYLVNENILSVNPMNSIKKRKEDRRPKAGTEDIIKQIFNLPNRKTFVGLRDYALLLLSMDTGIRPSEAFGLQIKDVSFNNLQVEVPANVAKTRISRILPISPITAEIIKKLIAARHIAWGQNVPLFFTENGGVVTSRTWQRRLEKYAKEIGTKITPYQLRHTFATMFLRHGGNPFALQQNMGHATMTTTRLYINLVASDIREQHDIATPLNSLVTVRHRVRNITT